jgi:hypothetical protein
MPPKYTKLEDIAKKNSEKDFPDNTCQSAIIEIAAHNFTTSNYDVNNAQFKTDLGTAQKIIENCNQILNKINDKVGAAELEKPDKELVEYIDSDEFNKLTTEPNGGQKEQVKKVVYNLFKNQMFLMAILICKHFEKINTENLRNRIRALEGEIQQLRNDDIIKEDGYKKKLKNLEDELERLRNQPNALSPFVDKVLAKLESLNKVKAPFINALREGIVPQPKEMAGGNGNDDDILSQDQINELMRQKRNLIEQKTKLQIKLNKLEQIERLNKRINDIYKSRNYAAFGGPNDTDKEGQKIARESVEEIVRLKTIENVDSNDQIFRTPIIEVIFDLEEQIRKLNDQINDIDKMLPRQIPRPNSSRQEQLGGTLGNMSFSKFMYKASKYLYLTDKAYNKI